MSIIPINIATVPKSLLVVIGSTGKLSQPYFPAINEKISCPQSPRAIILDIPILGMV